MIKLSAILTYARQITAGNRLSIALVAVVGVVRVSCGLLFIWLCKQLIDIAVHDTEGALLPYAVLLIATLGVEIACGVVQRHLETSTEAAMKNSLRRNLFSSVMNSTWDGREKFHTGDVVNRIEEDVRVVSESLCKTAPNTVVAMLQAAGAFLFLIYLSPVLGWVVAGILPIFILTGKLYTRRMRRLTEDIRTTDSRVQTLVQEHLQHRTLILGLLRTDWIASRLGVLQSGLYEQVMRRNRFTQFARAMTLVGFAAGYLTAFLWGVTALQQGVITFGVLTAFLQLVGQVQRPTADLSHKLPGLIHALTSTSRLMELAALPSEEDGAPTNHNPLTGIRFSGVSFGYPNVHREILHHFTHDFPSGSSTAIVGETGVGKSTLMRLMLGILRPQSGTIHLYNEQGEQLLASSGCRGEMIFVPQGNSLLSGTVRDNLLLGNPDATSEQLKEALHTAAADFVLELPLGIDTPCGEQGAGLSEGQAQRIGIARGLLCEGSILLLDEFSSALDRATEELLIERITAQSKGKTLIFITHRQEVAQRCDHIIELQKH